MSVPADPVAVSVNGLNYQTRESTYDFVTMGGEETPSTVMDHFYQASIAAFQNIVRLTETGTELSERIENGNYAQELYTALYGGSIGPYQLGQITLKDSSIQEQYGPQNLTEYKNGVGVTPGILSDSFRNGIVEQGTDGDQRHYISTQMAHALNMLIGTLKQAGVPLNGTVPTTAQILAWKQMITTSGALQEILRYAVVATPYNRSLQSLIELIYIRTGNELLVDKLGDMEVALSTTKDTLNIMEETQNVHNLLTAEEKAWHTEWTQLGADDPAWQEVLTKQGGAVTPDTMAKYLEENLITQINPRIEGSAAQEKIAAVKAYINTINAPLVASLDLVTVTGISFTEKINAFQVKTEKLEQFFVEIQQADNDIIEQQNKWREIIREIAQLRNDGGTYGNWSEDTTAYWNNKLSGALPTTNPSANFLRIQPYLSDDINIFNNNLTNHQNAMKAKLEILLADWGVPAYNLNDTANVGVNNEKLLEYTIQLYNDNVVGDYTTASPPDSYWGFVGANADLDYGIPLEAEESLALYFVGGTLPAGVTTLRELLETLIGGGPPPPVLPKSVNDIVNFFVGLANDKIQETTNAPGGTSLESRGYSTIPVILDPTDPAYPDLNDPNVDADEVVKWSATPKEIPATSIYTRHLAPLVAVDLPNLLPVTGYERTNSQDNWRQWAGTGPNQLINVPLRAMDYEGMRDGVFNRVLEFADAYIIQRGILKDREPDMEETFADYWGTSGRFHDALYTAYDAFVREHLVPQLGYTTFDEFKNDPESGALWTKWFLEFAVTMWGRENAGDLNTDVPLLVPPDLYNGDWQDKFFKNEIQNIPGVDIPKSFHDAFFGVYFNVRNDRDLANEFKFGETEGHTRTNFNLDLTSTIMAEVVTPWGALKPEFFSLQAPQTTAGTFAVSLSDVGAIKLLAQEYYEPVKLKVALQIEKLHYYHGDFVLDESESLQEQLLALEGARVEADPGDTESLKDINGYILNPDYLDGQGNVIINSILGKLIEVENDFTKAKSHAASGLVDSYGDRLADEFVTWMLDSYSSVEGVISESNAGGIQRNITAAISAGQSLNDQEKEEVRRYLFVFEEYYKSAAAILSKITQIIEKMAQGIGR